MLLTIYQSRSVHNKTSQFFTTNKEWARQFTQSGLDSEVRIAKIDPKIVYMDEPLPQATNVNELKSTIKKAINGGFSAVWVNEGNKQPPSILVINMKSLRIMRQSIVREGEREDFLSHHYTGYIGMDAYKQYRTEKGLEWLANRKYPKLLEKKQHGPYTVEYRQTGEIMLGGNEDQTVVAFIDGKPIGWSSNEFGAVGVWVVEKYQRLGIGAELMEKHIEQRSEVKSGKSKIGQMTPAGQKLTMKYYDKMVAKHGPNWFKKPLTESFGDKTPLEKETEDFRLSLIHQYPQIEDLFFSIRWSQDVLHLSDIRIKKEFRQQGIGKKVIGAIKDFADDHKLIIVLSPESEWGYKKKLDRFYKSSGFIPNRGRKKNYSFSSFFGPTMYRKPGINEGAILMNRLDKNAISKYINDMNEFCEALFHYYKEINCEKLESILQTKSDSLKSNIFPFKIKYTFRGRGQGYYTNDPPTINIVFSSFTDAQEAWIKHSIGSWERSENWERSWKCSKLDFKKLSVTFLHEFVHYIQDTRRREKSGFYTIPSNMADPKKYYKRGQEQQAQAIGYLEKLRKELNIKKPEELLNQLRAVGVLHNKELNRLKQSDYKSWKSIMKQATMTAIADIKDKSK